MGVGAQNERLLEGVHELVEGRERFDTFTVDFADDAQYEALAQQVATSSAGSTSSSTAPAYAPRAALEGRFMDTTLDDFNVAMNTSAYSFVKLCQTLEPLLNDDASVVALSYIGSTRAMPKYNVMGVCKAALESAVATPPWSWAGAASASTPSPPVLSTPLAARGIPGLKDMIKGVQETAPLKRPYGQQEAGAPPSTSSAT